MPKRILFIAPSLSSFIRLDIEILEKHFDVTTSIFNWQRKVLTPFLMIAQFFSVLKAIFIHRVNFIVISFAGYWSFIPSFLGMISNTKVYVIVHGTDACNFPEIDYGSLRKPILRWVIKRSYEWCYMLLPVSDSLIRSENNYFIGNQPKQIGVLAEFPNLKLKYTVVPNAFKTEFWTVNPVVERSQNVFVTVASDGREVLKGIDLIVELARQMPQIKVVVVGMNMFNGDYPSNVHFVGRKTQAELKEYFYRSQFYFQLSVFEGFGCALCEAMLCGCIPIGSKVNMLPEIIGDSGYILEKRDIEILKRCVEGAMDSPKAQVQGALAAQNIKNNYSLKTRENLLLSVLTK